MDYSKLLTPPTGKIDAVIDTDAYNEIDDQFAISYMLRSEEKICLKALYAAPFHNPRSSGPEDGMERSYNEILKLLTLAERDDLKKVTFRGSRSYLVSESTPVDSPAARDLAERAMCYTKENPLYVVAIGAITNVASALIMRPEIREHMVVVWLGGNSLDSNNNFEFNILQDVAAARVVMGCGVPFVQLPCRGVVDHFYTTAPELNYWLIGKNPLADYLAKNTIAEAETYAAGKPWSRVIWDVTAVAWLLNEGDRFMSCRMIPTPIPQYDHHISHDFTRHPMCYVHTIYRDALMEDLIAKLTR